VLTWLAVTFLTPPETDATLVSFYRRVFPSRLGWSRIADLAPEVVPDSDLSLRIAAAVIGSITIFIALPAMGDWILGNTARATGLTVVALLFGGVMMVMLHKIAPSDATR
jgi:SSS family solute:Na+ symporter